jgi:hypothetical protein
MTVPWCRFFVAKMASPGIKADDPNVNDHISYAKCIKGHVLKDANDWILCENLPAPDSLCWQEGGETTFSLARRARNARAETQESSLSQNGARNAIKVKRTKS